MRTTVMSYCLAVLAVAFSIQDASAVEPVEYQLARAPQHSTRITVESWAPFLKRISADAGVNLKLIVYDSREKFEGDFLSGQPDFSFGNPLYAVMGYQRHGYVPLIRDGAHKLKGIIVVRKDSNIEIVADLAGKTIAFPDPNALAASLLPRTILSEEMHIEYNSIFVGAHENVYRTVFYGKADAGGGVVDTLESEPAQLRDQLKIIFETSEISPHPLLAHPRVPVAVQKAVAEAILKLVNDEEGKKLLAGISVTAPILANYERDYAAIEKYGFQSQKMKTKVNK